MDIDTYYTDSTGKLMMPEPLGFGNYELIEQCSAYGYVLDSTPVPFKVDGTQTTVVVETLRRKARSRSVRPARCSLP